jgi:hypothetical protein
MTATVNRLTVAVFRVPGRLGRLRLMVAVFKKTATVNHLEVPPKIQFCSSGV